MRSTMNADLSLVARYLNEYYDLLQQLVSENRFARFVTSNRVRKKLELLNSNLHTEVAKIFMRLRTERRTPRLPKPPARNHTIAAYLDDLDPEGRQMWEESFGENPMVDWPSFMEVYTRTVSQPVNETGLRYLLDNAGTNSVSLYKFSEFLKGFGPLHESPRKVHEVISAEWFHGYLSSDEAVRLLDRSPPYTFLIRISKSKLGSFALAYVNEHGSVAHTLILVSPPHGFRIYEEVNHNSQDRVFSTLTEVVQFYHHMLQVPFSSSLAREAWFHGDLSSQEAVEALQGQPEGTFLFRFSSHKGCLAVSYVQDNEVVHGKVELSEIGFRFEKESREYLSLQALVDDYKKLLRAPLENVAFPQTARRGASNGPGRAASPGRSQSTDPYRVIPSQRNSHEPSVNTNYKAIPALPTAPASPVGARARSPSHPHVSRNASGRGAPARMAVAHNGSPHRSLVLGRPRAPPNQAPRGVLNASADEYSPIPAITPPDNPQYGSVPQNGDDSTGPNYGSVPTSEDYGSLPVGADGKFAPPNQLPGSSYGSIPSGQSTPGYGSVPSEEKANGRAGVGYGSMPQGGIISEYGSLPQGMVAENYGNVPK